MPIEYRKGDVLQESKQKRIIAHLVNNRGGFGKGFALSIANKYPNVKNRYKIWYRKSILDSETNFILGNIQTIKINDNLYIANLLAQDGYKTKANPVAIRYFALEESLEHLNNFVDSLNEQIEIWMPKIGTGLAGGDWNIIENIIEEKLKNKKVIVFEYGT
jgi:O-acetyl-ADP-ribose deacetylase (regulator of RNase III)